MTNHSKHSWYECPECAHEWLEKFSDHPEEKDTYIKYLESYIELLQKSIERKNKLIMEIVND